MATTKPVTKSAMRTVVKKVEEPIVTAETQEVKKVPRKYEAEELISVRSVTQGELILPGKKSGIIYRWYSYGDITEVEYQDLYTLKSSRSSYIYSPLFVIEDEELLEDPRWKDVKEIYDKMQDEDLDAILRLSPSDFETVFKQLPKGLQNAVKIEVATRIENNSFDSLSMIKAIDRVCGSDLICMIN